MTFSETTFKSPSNGLQQGNGAIELVTLGPREHLHYWN